MDAIREKSIRTKEQDNKRNPEQQKDIRENYSEDERGYRVVSDDNSIYEYDLNCVGEESESN